MFRILWSKNAAQAYTELRTAAEKSFASRQKSGKKKSTSAEGLFKQVAKCLDALRQNSKHPGLQTHEYQSFKFEILPGKKVKVFESYAQNRTPGAYRIFWCYGPSANEITIVEIVPHP
jgi:hypothetical protein